MNPIRLTAIIIVGASVLALAACGGGKKTAPPTATTSAPTATSQTTSIPATTGTPAATEQPFQGGRDPVDVPGPTAPPVIVLSDVRAAAHAGYDRITFQFEGDARPAYRVQYITLVAEVVGCGSGEPVPLTGNAFLKVRFTPVDAHNDQGQSTIGSTDLTPGLTTLQEAALTCDFEAVDIWTLGLSQEVDFRVIQLDNPPRIAVDVAHP